MGSDEYFRFSESIRLDLLEIFGRGYVIEHCISSFQKHKEEMTYRVYVTDLLRYMSGNNDVERYYDLIKVDKKPQKNAKEVKDKIRVKFR